VRLAREVLLVVRRAGEVLVVHRSPDAYWHVVAGGVEDGETDEQAAQRELEEETGLVAELRPERLEFAYPIAEEPHRRARFPPGTASIQVACFAVDAPPGWEPRLNEEHDDHRWCTVAEARRLMRWQDAADAVACLAE
jgi:dATP pyrophosphohydrolase